MGPGTTPNEQNPGSVPESSRASILDRIDVLLGVVSGSFCEGLRGIALSSPQGNPGRETKERDCSRFEGFSKERIEEAGERSKRAAHQTGRHKNRHRSHNRSNATGLEGVSESQAQQERGPASIRLVEKNEGEIVKTESWGLLNLSYLIKKNKKGSFIHFKIKGKGSVIDELEKSESIDKKLLRYLTVRVKDFDLETNYFSKKDDYEKKEKTKN